MVDIVPELQVYRINCLQSGEHQVAQWEQEMLSLGRSRVWSSPSAMEIKFLKFWSFTVACKSPSHTQQSHIWSLTIHFGLLASLAPVTGLCSVNLRDSTLFTIPVDENVMWHNATCCFIIWLKPISHTKRPSLANFALKYMHYVKEHSYGLLEFRISTGQRWLKPTTAISESCTEEYHKLSYLDIPLKAQPK